MSINGAMVILRDVKEFTLETAEFIALEVAMGASVKELHDCHEEMVPSPLVVNRWRKNVPAFDLVMREAEEAKAQGLADEVIGIAADEGRQAAISGNMIKSRQWLAGQLSEGFRNGPQGGAGSVKVDMNVRLTDEQLMAIAAGKFNAGEAIDGQLVESVPTPALEADLVEDDRESGFPVGVDPEPEEPMGDGRSVAEGVSPGGDGVDRRGRSDAPDDGEGVSGGWGFLTSGG